MEDDCFIFLRGFLADCELSGVPKLPELPSILKFSMALGLCLAYLCWGAWRWLLFSPYNALVPHGRGWLYGSLVPSLEGEGSRGLINISEFVLGISSYPHQSRCEIDWLGELSDDWLGQKRCGSREERGRGHKEGNNQEGGLLRWKLPFYPGGRAAVTEVQTLSTWQPMTSRKSWGGCSVVCWQGPHQTRNTCSGPGSASN